MSSIRHDKNGLPFVIINGGVYRPQAGPHDAHAPTRDFGRGIQTQFSAGDIVKVRHIGSSQCVVKSETHEEQWTNHGNRVKEPEMCFYAGDYEAWRAQATKAGAAGSRQAPSEEQSPRERQRG